MAKDSNEAVCCELLPWGGDAGNHVRMTWVRLMEHIPGATIFHHARWFSLVHEEGLINPTQVLSVRDRHRTLALIPLQKRSLWTWELPVPVSIEYPPRCVAFLTVKRAFGCLSLYGSNTSISFKKSFGCCAAPERIAYYQQTCQANRLVSRLFCGPVNVHIPQADDWESFLADPGKSTRSKLRHADSHLLEAENDFHLAFLTDPAECRAGIDELIRLYRIRWDDQVGSCIFSRSTKAQF